MPFYFSNLILQFAFLITIGFFIGFILKDPYGDFMNEQKFKTDVILKS